MEKTLDLFVAIWHLITYTIKYKMLDTIIVLAFFAVTIYFFCNIGLDIQIRLYTRGEYSE